MNNRVESLQNQINAVNQDMTQQFPIHFATSSVPSQPLNPLPSSNEQFTSFPRNPLYHSPIVSVHVVSSTVSSFSQGTGVTGHVSPSVCTGPIPPFEQWHEDKPAGGDLNPRKYKTRLCRGIMSRNGCAYGTNCAYAHSESELQSEMHRNKC